MAKTIYRGDAVDVAKTYRFTPSNLATNDVCTVTINGKSVSYTALSTTVADYTAGIVAALSPSPAIPEFSEVTATDGGTYVDIAAATAGTDIVVTVTNDDDGSTVLQAAGSGAGYWNLASNWDTGQVPETGDDVIIEDGDSDLLYGLRQIDTFTANASTDVCTAASGEHHFVEDQKVRLSSSTTLPSGLSAATDYYMKDVDQYAGTFKLSATRGGSAVDITDAGTGTHTVAVELNSITTNARWTGNLGLQRRNPNGYYEYRPTELKIGVLSSGSKLANFGVGSGSASGLVRVDFSTYQVATSVYLTSGSSVPNVPALLISNTNASSTLVAYDGQVGVSIYAGESSQLSSISMREATVVLGDNVTVATIDKRGGELSTIGAITISSSLDISG